MDNKELKYPKWINRNSCAVCGREKGSYTPWWPDDQIHLYHGLPLCWTCARIIAMTYEQTFTPDIPVGAVPMNRSRVNNCDTTTYKRYLNDDKITMNAFLQNGEDMFAQECESRENLKIVNTKSNNWLVSLAKAMDKDVDQYKGVILKSRLIFDTDYFRQGDSYLIIDKICDEKYPGFITIVTGDQLIFAVSNPSTMPGALDFRLSVEDYLMGRYELKRLVPEKEE